MVHPFLGSGSKGKAEERRARLLLFPFWPLPHFAIVQSYVSLLLPAAGLTSTAMNAKVTHAAPNPYLPLKCEMPALSLCTFGTVRTWG